jgi:pimeloyl-ACP methyl ester carboxylesterase
MSLGAMVAVAWADAHPDDVAGCVLINTSLQPFSRFYQRLRPHNYGALLKLTLFDNSDRETERRIFALTSRLADPPAGVLETWVRCRREHPVSRSNTLRQLLAATRYRAPQAKPATQMLVLCSAGDTLVDPHCSRQLARTWMTDFAEHPTAGHDIPLDDDKWVAQRVNDWLTRASPAPQKT